MTVVTAVPASPRALTGLADLVDLRSAGSDVVADQGEGWTDAYSLAPVLDGTAHLGRTLGPRAGDPVRAMERHPATREVVVGTDGPLVLPLCPAALARPAADRVVAVVLAPGQAVSLYPGTWHAPAMGIDRPSDYLWLADVDSAQPATWTDIDGGPIAVVLGPEALRG